MAKVALLIGVSEYGSGLNPLPSAVRDVKAVQQVLQPLEMGGFYEMKLLLNPNPPVMRQAIESLFSDRNEDDVVLLFFSGHTLLDDSGKLYFATSITSKSSRAELIRVSTIPASFVRELMDKSPCKRQVVILDCCSSHVSNREMAQNDELSVDIKTQLGGKGRAILASFTSIQNSLKSENFSHSGYTHYLVDGIQTGAADRDGDGLISVEELHEYASTKIQVAVPAVKPAFHPVEGGYKIPLVFAPVDDPHLKYRKEVENWVDRGEISQVGRSILEQLAESLQLTSEDCTVIEAEVLKPYQEYQEKLQLYEQEIGKAIDKNLPLDDLERRVLKSLQQSLGLRNEDVIPIEERIAAQLAGIFSSESETNLRSHQKRESLLLSSMPNVVPPEYMPLPAVQLANPTITVKQKANELEQSNNDSELQKVPATPNLEPSEYPPFFAVAPEMLNPDLASDVKDLPSLPALQTKSSSASTSPNKFLLPVGIGGAALATLVLAVGVSSRKPDAPPADSANRVASPPKFSQEPSSITKQSDQKARLSPIASPESQVCMIFVNGNLRSEPAAFRNNVIESLREPVPVTGKRTMEGWVQVRLSSGRLAWAHPEIISSQSEKEMEACLTNKGITVTKIEDIPPPPPSPSPPSRF